MRNRPRPEPGRASLVNAVVAVAVVAAVAYAWATLEVRRIATYEMSKIGHALSRGRPQPEDGDETA